MKVLDTAAFKDYMREEVEKNGGVTEDLKDRVMAKLKVSGVYSFHVIKITCINRFLECEGKPMSSFNYCKDSAFLVKRLLYNA